MKKIITLLCMILLFVGCDQSENKTINSGVKTQKFVKEKFLFGTYIKMIVFSDNKEKASNAMDAAFNKIGEIDKKYNSKTEGSLIYNLNHSQNKEIKLDSEGIFLFNEIKKVYDLSGEKYDITISPLLDLWGFGHDNRTSVPKNNEIEKTLKKVNFNNVIIKNNILSLKKPVEELDTGSFLKGYAIEKGRQVLKEKGIENGFITSVSSITTINGKPNEQPWRIGIQNPSNLQKIIGLVEIKNKSLGISGDYQTYVEIEGKKYHHIMDKVTGYPVNDKKLVVVICDSSFYADMYSTAFFNMEIDQVFRLAKKLDVEILIIDSENNIQTTKNFHLIK